MIHPSDQWLSAPGQSTGSGTPALVEAARTGDAHAFAALVTQFERMVYKVAIGITRHPEDASDVVQQTWLILLSKMHSIHTSEALPGWLSTTARREALRLVRERSRNIPLDPTTVECAEDPSEGPDSQVERRDLIERVNQALRQLPHQRRDFLVELVGRRAPYAEVAARFQFAHGSLGPLRARYLNQLSRALEECGVTAA
jgi:RNA polymerase sigma factor (sigma-70 family)